MLASHKLNDGTVRGWLVFWTLALALWGRPSSTYASELPNQRGGLYVAQRPVSMVSSTIDVRVLGLMVETTVTQRFRNDLSTPVEAVYIFPLPVDAIVTGAQLQVDGLVVKAELQRRAQARASYERAVAAGTAASLLEQERADVFTMAVTAIAPGATVEVVLAWDSVAQRGLDGWQLLLPLVVAPKQTPGIATGRPTLGTGRVPDTNRAPDASRLTPLAAAGAGIATTITVTFGDDVQNLRSTSHDLVTAADRRQVRIVEPQSNRDVVLRWAQPTAPRGWVEQDVDGGYAAVMVEGAALPSVASSSSGSPVTSKLAIIVDRSSRMQGARMALARIFVRAALLSLGTTVDNVAWVDGRTPMRWQASRDAAQASDAWLQQVQPRFDVVAALQMLRGSGANAALLISDGLYANDGEILAAARSAGVALYTVAVGSAPAHGLMRQLAASTQGTARRLAASEDATDVARAFALDCNAVATQPAVNWGALAVTQQVPATLPRLGVGQAVLVTGRLGTAATATIQVAGLDVGLIRRANNRASAGALSKHGQLARQWARGQLQTMDPMSASAVALAQRYGVVTPGTALVATSDVIAAPGGTAHSVAIPVDAPADQVRWREESLRVDAGVTATGQTTRPAGPLPTVVPADPSPRGASAASPDSDDADSEAQTYKDADAPSAARVQTIEGTNVYFRGRYGWRRTLTLAVGASTRADLQAGAAAIRYAGVVSGLVAGSYLWSNRWSLGGELGLALRLPNATVLARPLLTLGIVDRNGRTSLLVGLGYQAAVAPVASSAVDARAFAASFIFRVWLTDLDLKRWSIETRVNAAFNSNGFSNDISVGAALHW